MNTYIKGVCLATFLSVSGCTHTDINIDRDEEANVDLESYMDMSTRVDTGRVSRDDFVTAHPEFATVNFSAIGKLTHDGVEACSAVLLEPGNIIATAQHCITIDDLDLEYTFVTRDASGQTHTIPLPIHGTRYFQYLHVPTPHYFDPSVKITDTEQFNFQNEFEHAATDIAFFTLTQPIPKGVEPASIASAPTSDSREVFAAGYSDEVRDQKGKHDDGLSISKAPCSQSIDDENQDQTISTCYMSYGDSGGAEFIINRGKIEVTSIVHTFWENKDKEEGKEEGDISSKNETKRPPSRMIYGTPLAPMRNFCLENMGAEYCTGFPEPTPIS